MWIGYGADGLRRERNDRIEHPDGNVDEDVLRCHWPDLVEGAQGSGLDGRLDSLTGMTPMPAPAVTSPTMAGMLLQMLSVGMSIPASRNQSAMMLPTFEGGGVEKMRWRARARASQTMLR